MPQCEGNFKELNKEVNISECCISIQFRLKHITFISEWHAFWRNYPYPGVFKQFPGEIGN